MKKFLFVLFVLVFCVQPVSAMNFNAPSAPDKADEFMPEHTSTFSQDLWYVIRSAVQTVSPEIQEAAGVCLQIIVIVILVSIVSIFSGDSKRVTNLIGTLTIGVIILKSTNAMIVLGTETITELSDYGKLFLPVMTAALAAQGGVSTATALYTGTALFTAILTTMISKLLIPMLYLYICCCITDSAIGEPQIKRIGNFIKWLLTWSLKILLYVFTGYMTITGVVSGTVDSSAVKAAKLTISGAVPVIGNILSDASEAILVSAGVMKSSAGIYGVLTFVAIIIGPFLKIAIQYIMLKITAAVSEVFAVKEISALIDSFSSTMGFLLAMAGTVCLLLMIGTVCFIKGVG